MKRDTRDMKCSSGNGRVRKTSMSDAKQLWKSEFVGINGRSLWLSCLSFMLHIAIAMFILSQSVSSSLVKSVLGGCLNTLQGALLVTDDRGYVCPVEDVDTTTGCCLRGTGPYTCTGCDVSSKCCILYETCVSCCLKSDFKAGERLHAEFRIRGKPDTGHFTNEFDFCKSMCRTTKDCTLHENGYRSDFRYCFSEDGV